MVRRGLNALRCAVKFGHKKAPLLRGSGFLFHVFQPAGYSLSMAASSGLIQRTAWQYVSVPG
jgi:hypothetical protein